MSGQAMDRQAMDRQAMDGARWNGRNGPFALIALMIAQALCSAFFMADLIKDYIDEPAHMWFGPHLLLELLANIGLFAGIVVEGFFLRQMVRRQASADRAISAASGALNEVMETYFDDWQLTPAEADVARFTIKGCSIADIASIRNSAEGTIKTHLNAIYRKAGVSGRAQLVSLLIEELLDGPVLDGAGGRVPRQGGPEVAEPGG